MGFTPGTYGATDATGWSVATPTAPFQVGNPASPPTGSLIICVSNAGNDVTGDGSFATPYATPSVGNSHLRDGKPDWLLLRRGDTFSGVNASIGLKGSGQDANNRMVISNYVQATFNPAAPVCDPYGDTTPLPIWLADAAIGTPISAQGGAGAPLSVGSFIFISGHDIYGYKRDPASGSYDPTILRSNIPGIAWSPPAGGPDLSDVCIENCTIRWVCEAIGVGMGAPPYDKHMTNFVIRRNRLFNNYTIDLNGGDAFHMASCINPLIEENFIDYNGYYWSANQIITVSGLSVTPTAGAIYVEPDANGLVSTFTGTISGQNLSVSGVSGTIAIGHFVDGVGIAANTKIASGSGVSWVVNNSQSVGPVAMGSGAYTCTISSATATQMNVTSTYAPISRDGTLTKISGTGDASISYSQINVTVPGQYSFSHNFYFTSYADEFDVNSILSGIVLRGNISCRDCSGAQVRSGGTIDNNLWIQNPYPFSFGFPVAGVQTVVSNNVVIEGKGNIGQNYEEGIHTGSYQINYDQGLMPYLVQNNITCNATNVSPVEAYGCDAGFVGTLSNNIAYNWGHTGIDAPGGGIKTYDTIVAGSGATALPTFSGFIDDGTTSTFTVTAANATAGCTYTNSGNSFVVRGTISAGTTLITDWFGGGRAAAGPDTLTNASDNAISYSSFTNPSSGVYVFTVTAATAKAGTTYSNNGQTFVVSADISGGTTLTTTGTGAPSVAPSTLTNTSDSSISYSSFTRTAGHFMTVTAITGTPLTMGQQVTWSGMPGGAYVNIYADGTGIGGLGLGGTGVYQMFQWPGAASTSLLVASTTFTVQNYELAVTGSATGSNAMALVTITGTGGGVANIQLWDGKSNAEIPSYYLRGGSLYKVGDTVTAAVPGVTGFTARVASVASVTQSGNKVVNAGESDPYGFVDPTRTIGKYMQHIGLGSTTDDFFNAWRSIFKGNWNPDLTATNVNTWIAAGFATGGGGGGPTSPPPHRGHRGHIHHNVDWRPVR